MSYFLKKNIYYCLSIGACSILLLMLLPRTVFPDDYWPPLHEMRLLNAEDKMRGIHAIPCFASNNNGNSLIWIKHKTSLASDINPTHDDIGVIIGMWDVGGNGFKVINHIHESLYGVYFHASQNHPILLYNKKPSAPSAPSTPWDMAIYDISSQNPISSFPFPSGGPTFYAEHDGGDVFILTFPSNLRKWDPETGSMNTSLVIKKYLIHENRLEDVCVVTAPSAGSLESAKLLDDGKRIALFGWGHVLRILDMEIGQIIQEIPIQQTVSFIMGDISPDGLLAYGGGAVNKIGKFDVKTGKILKTAYVSPTGANLHGYRPTMIRLSPDGKWLAVGTGPAGDTYLYQTENLLLEKTFKHHTTVSAISFSPDSSHIAVEAGGIIRIWKTGF